MKVTLHVPTEQYGFVAPEIETDGQTLSPAAYTAQVYFEFANMFKPKVGLPDKEWNKFVDRMLLEEEGNHMEEYELMSEAQKSCVQVIKKAMKRISYKDKETL